METEKIAGTLLEFVNENIRYRNKLGQVMVTGEFLNMDDSHQTEAMDMFLDFLGDCKIIEQKEFKHQGHEMVYFLIQHPDLPSIDKSDIPFYNVIFEEDGSYRFEKALFGDTNLEEVKSATI